MPSPPKVPKPPAPAETAAAQIGVNREAMRDYSTISSVGQETPFGTLNYEIVGYDANGLPIRRAVSNLSPEQQGLLNTLQGTQGTAGQAGQTLLSNANYGEVPDLSMDAGSRVQANLKNFTDYWNPFFDKQIQDLDNQLRNQGIMPGSTAYQRTMNEAKQTQNQTISGFLAQMQPTAFNQAVTSYGLPFQTASSLAQFGAPSSLPNQFVRVPESQQTKPPDIGNIQAQFNQAQQFGYNAQLAQQQALLGGISSIGAAALPFLISDARVKENIEPVGKTFDGITLYRYTFKGDPTATTFIGFLAQEVEKKIPSAVREINGIKVINYRTATNNSAKSKIATT